MAMAAGAVSFLKPLQAFAGFVVKPVSSSSTLTILHSANLNGQWLSVPQANKGGGLGGLQHMGRKIAEIKQSAEAVLLIHCGSITGTRHEHGSDCLPFYRELGRLGYDAITPSTSDLLKGRHTYQHLSQQAGLPEAAKGGATGGALLPNKALRKGSVQVGFIEVLSQAFSSKKAAASQLNNTAAYLREQGRCNLIICNIQDGAVDATALATQSTGVDVMLCASERLLIYNTTVVKNKLGNEVILSYPGPKGTMLSRIDLNFDQDANKTGFASQAIFIGAVDESYARTMKRYRISYT